MDHERADHDRHEGIGRDPKLSMYAIRVSNTAE
jgi:hypothetical protein